METTGTRLVSQSKEEGGFTIFGNEEQIAHAERLIKGIVVKILPSSSASVLSSSCIFDIYFYSLLWCLIVNFLFVTG